MDKRSTNPLSIRDCGLMAYRDALDLQKELVEKLQKNKIPNTVLIVEHKPVITQGARKSENKILASKETLAQKGIEVASVRRGGGTTAHNPGQIVLYPILNLQLLRLGVNEYIRELEAIGAELLEQYGIKSERKTKYPGLWIGEKKIASIGVKIKKWITFHGMAININNDLGIFETIVPCGLENVKITNLSKQTNKEISMNQVKQKLAKLCAEHFSSEGLVSYES